MAAAVTMPLFARFDLSIRGVMIGRKFGQTLLSRDEMTMYTRTAADAIHNSTKHGTPAAYPERLVSYPRLDPANAPTPFKEYRHFPTSPLPRELLTSIPSAVRVLGGERGDPSPLDASLLATLLYLAAGVTRVTAGSARGRVFFRAAMSAGNLHPVEVYVIAGPGVDGVPAGVHHFAPLAFGLTELRRGDFRAALSITAPAGVEPSAASLDSSAPTGSRFG